MKRKKIIAGNWKMNNNLTDAKFLANKIFSDSPQNEIIKIIFPPVIYLHEFSSIVKSADFKIGAQNCSQFKNGAYTGELSAEMIASVGAEYCLVGHSERRNYFFETSKQLSEKIKRCLENNLIPIFCVGEKLDERESNTQFSVVENQLTEVLMNIKIHEILPILIAYEPVWAIGTGETATPKQVQEMHAHIRTVLKNITSETISLNMPILYGGSCNPQNAKEIFACKDVDGGLIGGASLNAQDFISIINSF